MRGHYETGPLPDKKPKTESKKVDGELVTMYGLLPDKDFKAHVAAIEAAAKKRKKS